MSVIYLDFFRKKAYNYIIMSDIIIRKYRDDDCNTISELFFETVHSVNAKDYTTEQLFAWAQNAKQLRKRNADLSSQITLIAVIEDKTVGFGSITESGYLDLLFTHKDFQNQGIATALCNKLEENFITVTTHASITAKPFFEKRGYFVIKSQEVERFGIKMINYEMRKIIQSNV